MKKFILSIDGGGIRGIIPSIFLTELKSMFVKNGITQPFHKIFDLMAGTSTGGLITLALSVPLYKNADGTLYDPNGGILAEQLPKLYQTLGDRVFPGNRKKTLKLMRQVFTSKYNPFAFQMVLKDLFKNCTVKQALTNVLITSFDMKTMHPVFMKKRPASSGGDTDPDFYMVDAALSTAAVPTFFPPAYVRHIENSHGGYCLIDGGIFCINPGMSALTEARKIFPGCEYVVLSLGTGTQREEYKTETIKRWGFFNWIAPWLGVPLITAVGEGQRISTNHMLKKLPQVTFFRMDVDLDKGKGGIDDGSVDNLKYLEEKGIEMASANRREMEQLISIILSEKKLN